MASPTASSILSEAARALPRAGARIRPREPVLSGGLRRAQGRGLLAMAVPKEFGGYGMTLAEVTREQRGSPIMPRPPRWR